MSYYTTALLARDGFFNERAAACAATEGVTDPHPKVWADQHAWQLAAAPGFDAAYSYALSVNVPEPGRDESVISDAMILSAVQAIRTAA